MYFRALWIAVGNHIVFNPIVDHQRHHASVQQVRLGPIRPEAHNAPSPGARHAGNLEQLAHTGVIDVDARFRRRSRCRCARSAVAIAVMVGHGLSCGKSQRDPRQQRDTQTSLHRSILIPMRTVRKQEFRAAVFRSREPSGHTASGRLPNPPPPAMLGPLPFPRYEAISTGGCS